jgi:hypothetical protein
MAVVLPEIEMASDEINRSKNYDLDPIMAMVMVSNTRTPIIHNAALFDLCGSVMIEVHLKHDSFGTGS